MLVALTLLMIGLIPAFLQATNSLQLTGQVRNGLIASHLAQEGAEVIEALRDKNWMAGQAFDTGLTTCAAGCRVQYDSTSLLAASAVPLKFDAATGLYQYTTGTNSAFTRTITITEPTTHELVIISTVTWTERTTNKSFSVEVHLFDWLK